MGIRAVVFDIGGVLETTPATGWPERWETTLGLEDGALAKAVGPIWRLGRTGHACLEEIVRETELVLQLSNEQSQQLWEDVWTEYLGALNETLMDYACALKRRHQIALLSNSFVGAREREQTAYRFEDHFDLLVYSHEVGMEKPDPRIYKITCQRLGIEYGEAIFVDDVEGNVAAASQLGMHGVVFENNHTCIRQIERCLRGSCNCS